MGFMAGRRRGLHRQPPAARRASWGGRSQPQSTSFAQRWLRASKWAVLVSGFLNVHLATLGAGEDAVGHEPFARQNSRNGVGLPLERPTALCPGMSASSPLGNPEALFMRRGAACYQGEPDFACRRAVR